MNKILLLAAVCVTLACVNMEELNRKQIEAGKMAEIEAQNSTADISELPLGFRFGMTEAEVMQVVDSLIENRILSKTGDEYKYTYQTNDGKGIGCRLDVNYGDMGLYELYFYMDGATYEAIDKDISVKLDSSYKRISYYEKLAGSSENVTHWYKENQIITLSDFGPSLAYTDAPRLDAKIRQEIEANLEKRKESGDDYRPSSPRVEVKNSSWDGSVSQVKKYLKENLKDPKSYEGIEWGQVQKTGNSYAVWHKYRAKNSFGGYVVETQIFTLDESGNVTGVTRWE